MYIETINIESIMQVYRGLRETSEYQLRYDEAGKFFFREMEIRRLYRSSSEENSSHIIIRNDIVRRTLSLTGIYFYLGKYGQSILNPTLLCLSLVGIGTFVWSSQLNPDTNSPILTIDGLRQVNNVSHYTDAIERTISSFVPFLPLLNYHTLWDYALKGLGVIGLGLIAIALRRKFERRFRH